MGARFSPGRLLRSQGLAVGLLLSLAALAAAGSAFGPPPARDVAKPPPAAAWQRVLGYPSPYSSPLFVATVLAIALNVSVCTWHRAASGGGLLQGGGRRVTDLALHGSLILVLMGAAAKGALGKVRTEAVAVGTETDRMYDWGAGRDEPLGFALRVDDLREERFPLRLRLGVRRAGSGEKVGLVELTEGAAGAVPGAGLEASVAGYDQEAGTIRLRVRRAGEGAEVALGTAGGDAATREALGFRFSVVSWRSDLRTVYARVTVLEGGRRVAAGKLEPNARFEHRGLGFFLTRWGRDEYGTPYAGIQAVSDPGAPVFWAGCALLACALPLHVVLKGRGRG